jgi:hypothetical protein
MNLTCLPVSFIVLYTNKEAEIVLSMFNPHAIQNYNKFDNEEFIFKNENSCLDWKFKRLSFLHCIQS